LGAGISLVKGERIVRFVLTAQLRVFLMSPWSYYMLLHWTGTELVNKVVLMQCNAEKSRAQRR